ncbi:MAG: hypothetical protein ACFNUN_04420 [Aggregatibacter sp.]
MRKQERENTCWDGGNTGHQKQITDIGNRMSNCQRYMR